MTSVILLWWRKLTRRGRLAALSSLALVAIWFLRRLQFPRRKELGVPDNESPEQVPMKSTISTSATFSSGVDESLEPRAEEAVLPPLIQSRLLRHVSFHDVYDVGEPGKEEALGEGMNGPVLRATHRHSGHQVAAKMLKASEGEVPVEVILDLRLSHPNICRLLQVFIEEDACIWLCMELCSGGELFDLAAGNCRDRDNGQEEFATEARIASLVQQMAAALRYMHSMGIVHRDIKLENWVFASPHRERLKLIDFGLAASVISAKDQAGEPSPRRHCARKLRQMCGTPYYVAPEIVGEEGGKLAPGSGYGQEVDIWALGVVLYMLISGTPPFDGRNQIDVLWKIVDLKSNEDHLHDAFVGLRWKNVSCECKDLITRCLQVDPSKRITAAGVQMHPWMSGHVAPRQPVKLPLLLEDLSFAGRRARASRMLAYICGYLAFTIHLSPQMWSLLKEQFAALEMLEKTSAPRGSLALEKLAAASSEDTFLAAVCSLDLTGDGRLHFFEFLAAMIAAGRIKIYDFDVLDVFAAFDLDEDGLIGQADLCQSMGDILEDGPDLGRGMAPIEGPEALLALLNLSHDGLDAVQREDAQSPKETASEPNRTPLSMVRLSKAELNLGWQVQRQFAYDDITKAGKLRSLGRGYRTPDPSPTRQKEGSDGDDAPDFFASPSGRGKRRSTVSSMQNLELFGEGHASTSWTRSFTDSMQVVERPQANSLHGDLRCSKLTPSPYK